MPKNITIYLFQMSGGHSYKQSLKETLQEVFDRTGLKDQALIDKLNGIGAKYFIGTQAEYDSLKNPKYYYYKLNGNANSMYFYDGLYLKDGHPNIPTFKEMIVGRNIDDAVELTKAAYDILKAKNEQDKIFAGQVSALRTNSAPKADAYIKKCSEYITNHYDKVTMTQLPNLRDKNGKLDSKLIDAAMLKVTGKINSMVILANVFLEILKLIEAGTVADIDKLPTYDPIQLNNYLDSLWDKQQAEEQAQLMKVMGWTKADLMLIDKYSMTNSDEVYQEPVKEWSRKKAKSLKDMGAE